MAGRNDVYIIRLLMVGDSGVGKARLMLRFCNEHAAPSFITSIGIDFKVKTITIRDKTVKLQIWDSAGQEHFRTTTQAYYRGAHGVMLVYSCTDRMSFEHVANWMQSIEDNGGHISSVVLVGSKCEKLHRKVVERSEGEEFAKEFGLQGFFEVSAKQNINIEEAFMSLATDCVNNKLIAENGGMVESRKVRTWKEQKRQLFCRCNCRSCYSEERFCGRRQWEWCSNYAGYNFSK